MERGKTNKKRGRTLLFTSLFSLVFSLFVVSVPGTSQALTLSPPSFDYAVNSGDTVLDVLKLYNETSDVEVYYPTVLNFSANSSEDGTPRFYSAEEDRLGQGLAEWIGVDGGKIELQPGDKVSLPFSINVPREGARPGGHYGAIVLSSSPPSEDGVTVGIAAKLAAIILVRVSGEVSEVGNIVEFGLQDPQPWYNYLPVEMFMRFENSGNVHLQPTGNLIITDWIGRQAANIEINPEFKRVLPLSIRKYNFTWGDAEEMEGLTPLRRELRSLAIGKYRAKLVMSYGVSSSLVTKEMTFYVWPWRLMLIVGSVLLVLMLVLVVIKRSYDRSLLRRFRRMQGGA